MCHWEEKFKTDWNMKEKLDPSFNKLMYKKKIIFILFNVDWGILQKANRMSNHPDISSGLLYLPNLSIAFIKDKPLLYGF